MKRSYDNFLTNSIYTILNYAYSFFTPNKKVKISEEFEETLEFDYEDIHYSVINGNLDQIIQIISEDNAHQLESPSKKEQHTPLILAAIHGHTHVIQYLIKQGVDLNIMDAEGKTALLHAIIHNHFDVANILIHNGANLDLPYMPEESNLDVIDFGINDLNEEHMIEPWTIETPLIYAASNGYVDIVKALIDHGANLELTNNYGCTALYEAAVNGHQETVLLLLDNGANAEVQNSGQLNLIDAAELLVGKNCELSLYLQNRIGLAEDTLNQFSEKFKNFIDKELTFAKNQHKHPLIIFGENHNNFQIQQIEKVFLKVLSDTGIKTLFSELPASSGLLDNVINEFAHKGLNMEVIGVDNYPSRDESGKNTFINERNKVMAKEINEQNKSAVLITGAYHLLGLLSEPNSTLSPKLFHLIPFNLSSLLKNTLSDLSSAETKERHNFSIDSTKVIQIQGNDFSDTQAVILHWNKKSTPILFQFDPQKNIELLEIQENISVYKAKRDFSI